MASLAKRLDSNVAGDFYVDSTCIDCAACRWIAPATFDDLEGTSRVFRQPRDEEEVRQALKALVSCPTGSIGTVEKHDLAPIAAAYPDRIDGDVYHCGYHHERSFGATSYFIRREGGNVLVDSPRFTRPLVRRLEALGGVRLMFLTHRDDVADHQRFRDHFGCDRVLHRRDVTAATRAVEVQPDGDDPHALADDLLFIPTPGHTRGSACLLFARTYLFSGDHLAWSASRERVHAFADACWYDWTTQIRSVERLLDHRFEWILPGHGWRCRFPSDEMRERVRACAAWMKRVRG
jgi:glyoxylase-like metal-dependent hydrolase (beta-lactamase superfamily II)